MLRSTRWNGFPCPIRTFPPFHTPKEIYTQKNPWHGIPALCRIGEGGFMKENRHQAPLAPQQRYPRSSKGPIQHPLHTSRHHIRHEVHLSYAANWRIKHLAETWGVSYSEALDWLALWVVSGSRTKAPGSPGGYLQDVLSLRPIPKLGEMFSNMLVSQISAGTTCVTSGPVGTFRPEPPWPSCRNWEDGSPLRWCDATHIFRRTIWQKMRAASTRR